MQTTAAFLLAVVALLHTVLGEHLIIRPLLAAPDWRVRIPRRHAERMLRGGWHLTTLAWWGLSGLLLGWPVPVTVAVVCLASAVIVVLCVPGHLAWPLFTAAGLLALAAGGVLPDAALRTAVGLAVPVAAVAAAAHVSWALGIGAAPANVLPQRRGTDEPLGRPGALATLAVAGALIVYVTVLGALVLGADGIGWRWLGLAALSVLVLRVLGEGRYVGITKRVRDTAFARADDRYWTPVVGLLALGAASGLALAA